MIYHYSSRALLSCGFTPLPGELMIEAVEEDDFLYKQLTYDDSPDMDPVDYYTCYLSGDL